MDIWSKKLIPSSAIFSSIVGDFCVTIYSRRTFICFALASGIPPQVVMKWTGHSDYKSMKPYIDIATRTKSDAMKKIADSWEE